MKALPSKMALWVLVALLLLFAIINTVGFFTEYDLSLPLLIISLIVAVFFLFDTLTSYPNNDSLPLNIQRKIPRYFIINESADVELLIKNHSDKAVSFSLFDHLPDSFYLADSSKATMPISLTLIAGETVNIRYQVKPQQRGQATFNGIQIRLDSHFGLWQKELWVDLSDQAKIYPDFRQISQEELLSGHSLAQGNLSQQRQRGSGTDFDQLREYRIGDALSRIDHKASARFNKLISKQYQVERDQKVMILLDCSRRLRIFQGGLSHFDYALNSTVFLARTVLNQGDAVGIMTFGNDQYRYVPPKKGRNSVNKILNTIYDLHTSRDAPDYIGAAQQLMAQQKRRCLVILLTSLQDEDTDMVKTMLRILQKRHLVLIANLKPEILGASIDINTLDDAIFYASRETYNSYRDKMLQHIREQKLILLDTYPKSLTTRLLNLYLNIKQSGVF